MSHSRNEDKDTDPNLGKSHSELSRMILQGRSFSGLERNCSFLNTNSSPNGMGRFATISASSGLDFPDDGRGLAVVDWDLDGDLDLWLSARNAPRVRLMQNTMKNSNHYLLIALEGNGTTTNRDAIGARVEVVTNAGNQEKSIQTLRAGEGFLSQDSKLLHFGLAPDDTIKNVQVNWPGGKKELFSNITIDGRYTLVQGSGKAVALTARDQTKLALEPSKTFIPDPSENSRIALMTRLPVSKLPIRTLDKKPEILQPGGGGPVLVLLWASWCPTCKAELAELVERKDDLQKSGIGILALSVDGLGDDKADIELARKMLVDMQFPFPAGYATPELIQELQELHDLVTPLKHTLPVPASFLFDGKSQLSVIYKGKASVDNILRDTELLIKETPFTLEHVTPQAGRTINNSHLTRVADENTVRTLFQRGLSLGDRNRFDEALPYYQKALDLQPKSYKIHYNLGTTYAQLNNVESAIYHLKQSLFYNPEFLMPHKVMGNIYLRTGNLQKAAEHYKIFLADSPEDAEVTSSLGIIEARTNNLSKAEEYLRKAIELNPSFVEARYNLGAILLLQNKFKEAENVFLQILTIQPNYPDVLYNLGYIAEKKEEYQRGANLYIGELRNSPDSLKAITGLGRLLEKQGNNKAAKEYYSRAIGINPDYKPAIEGLARLNEN